MVMFAKRKNKKNKRIITILSITTNDRLEEDIVL